MAIQFEHVEGGGAGMMNLEFVRGLSRGLHCGQVDKMNRPYWKHPVRVALRMGVKATTDERIAALLHDTLEDTPLITQGLQNMGTPAEVMNSIIRLTRRRPQSYDAYITGIVSSGDKLAMRVKLADLYDNTSPSRHGALSDKHLKRYEDAIDLLERTLTEQNLFGLIKGDLK